QADLIFEIKSEKTFLNIDLFASYLQNYITSVKNPALKPRIATSPGVRQFVNVENAFKTGFEVNWKLYLFYGIQQQAAVAYTYAKNTANNEPLPEIAPFEIRYSLTGKHLNDKLISEISLRHVLKQDRISVEYGEKETPSFTNLDFNISYKLFKYLNVATGVQNIFDVAYYEHLNRSISGSTTDYIFNRGRNFHFTLVIDIQQ
ncbi:MAG TPA: TonB-dependent receptor, partial [Bacteroidales bacterium]|nr:TonB-dependent receptor [Bacteroidales bacterium]